MTARALAIAAAVIVGSGVMWMVHGRRLEGVIGALRPRPPVSQAQQALGQLGFDPGKPDGTLGPQTRRAVGAFQASYGLPATGHLDGRTWQTLRRQPGVPELLTPPSSPLPTAAAGSSAAPAPAPTAAAPATPATSAAAPGEPLTPHRIRLLQRALAAAGYDPGKVDGSFGQRTQEALRTFQRKQHLAPTGAFDAPTLAALKRFTPRDPSPPPMPASPAPAKRSGR